MRATEIVGETMWKLGVLERNIVVEYLIPTEEKNILLETSPIRYDKYSGVFESTSDSVPSTSSRP